MLKDYIIKIYNLFVCMEFGQVILGIINVELFLR